MTIRLQNQIRMLRAVEHAIQPPSVPHLEGLTLPL